MSLFTAIAGSSKPASGGGIPGSLIVSGAGEAAANGTYTRGADVNGNPSWYKGGQFQILHSGAARWFLYNLSDDWQSYQSTVAGDNASPVTATWELTGNAPPPLPTVVAG